MDFILSHLRSTPEYQSFLKQVQDDKRLSGLGLLLIFIFLFTVGCRPVDMTAAPNTVDLNAFSTQLAGTVVAQITQTAYVTPSETLPPTRTPYPTETPRPVYALDEKLKATIIDGNLYAQNGDGENIQLTDSKADLNPIFSDDGKKIVFQRRRDDHSFYSIDTDGSNEQKIFNVASLAVQGPAEIKALTFIKNTHILVFNIYICGPRPGLYNNADCYVSTYSVDADSGKTEEIGQRVSGIGSNDGNFEISPNQKYLSIAGSGHINIFSFSSGRFKLAYFGALAYKITRPDEFLPYQYWLPDSSGLIVVVSTSSGNEPGTPPGAYGVWRYTIRDNVATQIPLKVGISWNSGCSFSISPDRNWLLFISDETDYLAEKQSIYLGNLRDGSVKEMKLPFIPGCPSPLSNSNWNSNSQYYGDAKMLVSVDGSFTSLDGYFAKWIDASHYTYVVWKDDKNTFETYIAEIGGESILLPSPTPEP